MADHTQARRVVLTCWGSYGDLFPYLAMAVRLRERGHVPVLAASAFYRDLIVGAGVGFHPVPPDVDPSDAALMARVMDPARGSEVIVRELLAPRVEEAFESLRDAVRGADLLVTHPVTFAGPLVARATGMRWLSGVLAPTSFFSAYDLPILPPVPSLVRLLRSSVRTARVFLRLARRITRRWTAPVRAFSRALGLPEAGDPLYEGQFSPCGTLALFSPIVGPPQPDWPARTHATGFVFHDEAQALDPALQQFLDAGDPPIVFTLGTSAAGAPGRFYEESVRAAERLDRRAVLLVGAFPHAPSPVGSSAAVFATPYAPHAPLFRQAAAIVHHGGVGTLAQGLRAGRPMLVVPHAHDQFDNAARAERLGVGRVLDAGRYRADRAAARLGRLLDGPGPRERAEAVGRAVSAERGCDAACDLILEACRSGVLP